jgi:hypothetical protein
MKSSVGLDFSKLIFSFRCCKKYDKNKFLKTVEVAYFLHINFVHDTCCTDCIVEDCIVNSKYIYAVCVSR